MSALLVNVAGVPDVLKELRRWMLWRYEPRNGRLAKVPCQLSGRHAKANDSATWCTFAEAVIAYRAGRFDGIGFALGDGWAGVDLDHCRDSEIGRAFLASLGGYVEVSPSGSGYKAFGRCSRIGGEIDCQSDPPVFTTWQSARFFTVTGHGTGDPTVDLSNFIDRWFSTPVVPVGGSRTGYHDAANISDDEVLSQAIGADNGDKFFALWRGDRTAYGDDHSRADMALVAMLAFWTNHDAARVDRLFRQSGLMRPKWDSASYRTATLRKALR